MTKGELLVKLYALSEEKQDEFIERYGFTRISEAGIVQLEEFLNEIQENKEK